MEPNPHILKHHHITLSVGTAQEDYDFHTKVLGLKSVKKTALYDGDEPIYHLYYGNDFGRRKHADHLLSNAAIRSQSPPRNGTDQDSVSVCSGFVIAILGSSPEEARH